MKKVKSKKQIRKERRAKRFYGIVKVAKGEKFAWLSVQNKHGWSLGFALGKRTIWLRNVRFASVKDVKDVLDKKSAVFTALSK